MQSTMKVVMYDEFMNLLDEAGLLAGQVSDCNCFGNRVKCVLELISSPRLSFGVDGQRVLYAADQIKPNLVAHRIRMPCDQMLNASAVDLIHTIA